MDLLLTHGYFLREDPKELQIMKPYPPLGILYLSSHLRRLGFGVELYDSTFGSLAELSRLLETEQPGIVGIYGTLMTRRSVLAITAAAKARGWTVILGGPEPSNYAAEYLAHGADFVVEGEGEITLEELLAALRANDRAAPTNVRGLYYRDASGSVVFSGAREQIFDLNAQPWPDRERIGIEQYIEVWRKHHGKGSVSVITARGCPYHCRWCSHSTFGKTHRRRSAENVAEEVEWILERYHPDMLWMADDVFTIHYGWIKSYLSEVKRRGIRVPFECITRADRLTSEMADALAELGCFRVWVGSESGSQRILDAMERGVSVDEVRRAISLCRARGIETGMFLMWGYEGEELADIEATVEHVKACLPDIFFTTVSYPIKGTPYYDGVRDRLVSTDDWGRTSDRELRIRGRHSRQYFQFADTLLRSEVELHRLACQNGGLGDSQAVRELQARASAARRALQNAAQEVEA
jgi:radical SAM superfamily enzyme YgiQ (UPF0313 family)